jgi:hypothetical protein
MVEIKKQILTKLNLTQQQIDDYNKLVETTGPRYGQLGKCDHPEGMMTSDITHQAFEIHKCFTGLPDSYYVYIMQWDNRAGIELNYGRFEFQPRMVGDKIVSFDAIRIKSY